MLKSFIECAELALSLGGEVSFEWPRHCGGWLRPELISFITKHNLFSVLVDGCATGMTNKDDVPVLKQWRFITSSHRQAVSLGHLRCQHDPDFQHAEISGSTTRGTEEYSLPLCRTMLSSIFGSHGHAPAMPCCKPTVQCEHREHEVIVPDFGMSPNHMPDYPVMWDATLEAPPTVPITPTCSFSNDLGVTPHGSPGLDPYITDAFAAVTKVMERREWKGDAKALEAIRAEAAGLLSEGTWLLDTVIEKSDLEDWARAAGKKVHIGDLLLLCSIKFWEMPEAYRRHKGRICFRGDNAKDEYGALAVYQELAASPTAVHSANSNLAYGCIPGHKTTQADAIRAYVQSLLASKYETYVRIPRELWPQKWIDEGRKAPCCKLIKALYGHPEAGGHWEAHLHKAVQACGGVPVHNHPSSYWIEAEKLLLTVYVDDLLLSGPCESHDRFWSLLKAKGIKIDDPEDLDRFLGRTHVPL